MEASGGKTVCTFFVGQEVMRCRDDIKIGLFTVSLEESTFFVDVLVKILSSRPKCIEMFLLGLNYKTGGE